MYRIISAIYVLAPYTVMILLSVAAVNLDRLLAYKRPSLLRSLAAVIACLTVIFGGVRHMRASFEITVTEEFAPYVTEEQLAEARRTFLADSKRRLTFPTGGEVVRAGELDNGFCYCSIEADYFMLGRQLGWSTDGLYRPR